MGPVQSRWDAARNLLGQNRRALGRATWQGETLTSKNRDAIACLASAPDGRTLVTGDWGGNLYLWDVVQKRLIASRRVHASVLASVAFSPDGLRFVTGGGDSMVRLWDVATLQEAAAFSGPDGPIDRTACERLWAAASVATLTGHEAPVPCLAFSPDSDTLATGSNDASIRLWHAPPLPPGLPEPADAASGPLPVESIRLFSIELNGRPGQPWPTKGMATGSMSPPSMAPGGTHNSCIG